MKFNQKLKAKRDKRRLEEEARLKVEENLKEEVRIKKEKEIEEEMKTKPVKLEKETLKKENVDKDFYPEYYRKTKHVKRNNFNTLHPFIVARILKFKVERKEIKLKVGLFYRPESIVKSQDKEEENRVPCHKLPAGR